MIRIKKENLLQNITVTVTELKTLANPFYLFIFVHDMTKEELRLVLTDISIHKARYNRFRMYGDLLPAAGWYSYAIYEQLSDTNTDTQLTGGMVEHGRAYVEGENNNPFIQVDNEINFKEYAG